MFSSARALLRPAAQVRWGHGHTEFPPDVKVGRCRARMRMPACRARPPCTPLSKPPTHSTRAAPPLWQAKATRMIVEATVAGTVMAFMWRNYHSTEKAKARTALMV